jgi:ATP-binding cassette subfamily C protein CydD
VDPRLLRYARSSRGFLALAGAISFAQALCTLGFAWFLTSAITGVVDHGVTPSLWQDLALLGAVVLVRALLVWASERTAAGASSRIGSELRTAMLSAVRRLGPAWLARQNTARLTVTAGHGLEALDVYVGRFLPQLIATAIVTPILLLVIWWQDWVSGLTATLCLPLIPIFMTLIGWATQAVQRKQWDTLQHLAARFADTVEGLGTLRLFGRERKAVASMSAISDGYRRETMKVLRITFLSGFMLEFIASISVAIIAVSIGLRLLGGEMTLAVGLFVLLLAPDTFLPLRQVGVQFHAATEGVAAANDVFAVLDAAAAAPETSASAVAVSPDAAQADDGSVTTAGARLELHNVRVDRDGLLPPVSFVATPGTLTLLYGPSGAGKSSLLAALRTAAAYEGSITVDGSDVRGLHPTAWLAWAGQRPGLVTGTIAENITLGDHRDDETVTWALRTACADDLDPDLLLGVQGAGLSGGQAQRVAVARALYRYRRGHARVVALDEPSSALDADTEARLWQGLRAVADAGATILLVSHRASAEAIADQSIELSAPRSADPTIPHAEAQR